MALAQTRSRLLQIQLFGEPRFFADGALQTISLPPKAILLLCVLALKAGQPIDRAKLAFTLWPDDPEDEAKAKLRRHLHVLVRSLALPEDRPCIVASGSTLTWTIQDSCTLDVVEFERLSRSPEDLERAVTLYSGDLLANFYEEWLEPPRRRLRELQLQNLLALAERYGESEPARALEFANAALRIDPWREDALCHVLIARTQLGDRAGAMQQYTQFAKRLREEFDAEPLPETKSAFEAAKIAEPALTNLPLETTSFIGREPQLRALRNLLEDSRMVTLTGPGGVGKSRTAVHCARELVRSYREGVWLIEVSAQTSESSLVHAIAESFGLRELPQSDTHALTTALAQRHALLLLDNSESLVDVCARVCEAILASCEHMRILATSREPLGISGERTLRLAPFTDDFEAIALFFDRARAADAAFQETAENRILVGEICRRVDRLPLATELAAVRVATLSPHEILERLHDRFALLRRARIPAIRHHQTLRATIDWSYNLLSLEEKTLFRRLAMFPSAFTLSAAESICDDSAVPRNTVLDVLSRLVDKSLVTPIQIGLTRRYRFLDSIREYALVELYQSADVRALQDRYIAYYASLVKRCAKELGGPEQQSCLQMLASELDNIRTALQFGHIDDKYGITSLGMACDLQEFWVMRSLFAEGRRFIQQALDVAQHITPKLRALALSHMALLACFSEDREAATQIEEEALEIRRKLGDEAGVAQSLHDLANYAFEAGELERAHSLFHRALDGARIAGDEALVAKALDNVGLTSTAIDDFEHAQEALDESLRIYTERRDTYGTAWVLSHLGWLAERMREYQKGVDFLSRSMEMREDIGDTHGMALCALHLARCYDGLGDREHALEAGKRSLRLWRDLGRTTWLLRAVESFACAEALAGDARRGCVLLTAVEHLRDVWKCSLQPFERERHADAKEYLQRTLSAEDLRACILQGAAMSLDDTADFALANQVS